MLGHTIIANELIRAIESTCILNTPMVSKCSAWRDDLLNQNPVHMDKLLSNLICTEIIDWLIGLKF